MLAEAIAGTSGRPVTLRSIAAASGISEGYLEEIAACLRRAGIIRGARGRRGGYVLARAPCDIAVGDIIRALDGPTVLAACQDPASAGKCPVERGCASRHFFGRLKQVIDAELDATTLATLV